MFCINVLLTVNDPSDIAEIGNLLAQAARLSRQERGCVRFEVYHSQSQEDSYLLCERWESKEAWEAHRQERAFTEIYEPQVLPKVQRVPHISTLVE